MTSVQKTKKIVLYVRSFWLIKIEYFFLEKFLTKSQRNEFRSQI